MSREGGERTKAPPVIEINERWCKACGICVEFCPADVLAMDKSCARVVNLEACTRCQLCVLRCPDFAIVVKDAEDE